MTSRLAVVGRMALASIVTTPGRRLLSVNALFFNKRMYVCIIPSFRTVVNRTPPLGYDGDDCIISYIQVFISVTQVHFADMACAGICWSLIWLLLLLVGGWPIGGLCAGFYLLLSPFGACIEALTPLINLLEQGLKLPLTCALNLVHQKPLC